MLRIALNRGLFFPSAEIFGSNMGGFWDYGPLGFKIFNNILNVWREFLKRLNAVEISGSTILPRKVLKASGHEENFFDLTITCDKCGSIYRVDKLLEKYVDNIEGLSPDEYMQLIDKYHVSCPKCGGKLNNIKKFYLMFGLKVGLTEDANAYLRPEACQSIFLDFKRVFEANDRKFPLAIAQVGKAYRNEISPRNNLIRQREFYHSDVEIFFDDESVFADIDDVKLNILDQDKMISMTASDALKINLISHDVTAYALSKFMTFLLSLGIESSKIRFRKLYQDKAFYAEEAFDAEVQKGDEWVEVAACNYRGDYDLSSYEKLGADIIKINGKIPKIFELSAGADRIFYIVLYNSLRQDKERTWLSLKYRLAPYRAALFPLLSKEELEKLSESILNKSKYKDEIYYLYNGSIGKRYRKSDEVGIPLAFTVDYQTLEDSTVTVRDRDTMEQFRIKIDDIDNLIEMSKYQDFSSLKNKFSYSSAT